MWLARERQAYQDQSLACVKVITIVRKTGGVSMTDEVNYLPDCQLPKGHEGQEGSQAKVHLAQGLRAADPIALVYLSFLS